MEMSRAAFHQKSCIPKKMEGKHYQRRGKSWMIVIIEGRASI